MEELISYLSCLLLRERERERMSGVKDLHEVTLRWVRIYLLHVMTAEGVVASCEVKALKETSLFVNRCNAGWFVKAIRRYSILDWQSLKLIF